MSDEVTIQSAPLVNQNPPTDGRLSELLDFRNALYLTWKHLNVGRDPTPLQYDMADYLQNIVKPVMGLPVPEEFKVEYWVKGQHLQKVILEAFRGVGKSWITSALVPWVLYWCPHLNIMVVSAAKPRADDFTTFVKRLIAEMEIYQHLQPDRSKNQRDSMIAFDVGPGSAAHAASVRSVGIFGMMTGGRADILIGDDIEVPNNSETQGQREKLDHRAREMAGAILKPDGVQVLLGTPQTEESVYNAMRDRKHKVIIYPARMPNERWMAANGEHLAPILQRRLEIDPSLGTGGGLTGRLGKPTDTRFSESELQGREAEFGRSGFSLQFMLDTTLADVGRYPLKLRDLIVMDCNATKAPETPVWASSPELALDELPNPGFEGDRFYRPMTLQGEWIDYTGSVMAIDPAGRGKDELAWAIIKICNGFLYLVECRGVHGGFEPKNLVLLAKRAEYHQVNHIITEPNFGGGMFTNLLRPVLARIYPCNLDDAEYAAGQKERRIINALEPVMNSHKLVVDKTVVMNDRVDDPNVSEELQTQYRLFHQMTRITRDRHALRHDDRLDALAMAVSYWTEQMGRDAKQARQDRSDALLEEELNRLREHAIGPPPEKRGEGTWLSPVSGRRHI